MRRSFRSMLSSVMAVSFLLGNLAFPESPRVKAEGTGKLTEITNTSTIKSTVQVDEGFYNEILAKYDSSYNTAETALELTTPGQLAAFSKANSYDENGNVKDFSGKHIKLVNDIDLGGKLPTIEKIQNGADFSIKISGELENAWGTWIGLSNSISSGTFSGIFDGNYKEILNMVQVSTRKQTSGGGLFGSNYGTIKNLGISGNSASIGVVGDQYVGVLASINIGTIENCYAIANIYHTENTSNYFGLATGGLVGSIQSTESSLLNNYAIVNVYTKSNNGTGGLVGSTNGHTQITITNCFATGDVYAYRTDGDPSGGLIGSIATSQPAITNSYRNSDAIVSPGNSNINTLGTPLTKLEMTGIGAGRASEKMVGLAGNSAWEFIPDGPEGEQYFPKLTVPEAPPESLAEQTSGITGTQTRLGTVYAVEIEWGKKDNGPGLNFVYERGIYNPSAGKIEVHNNGIEAGYEEGTLEKWYGFDGSNNKVTITNMSNAQVKTTASASKNTEPGTGGNLTIQSYFDSGKSWVSEGTTAQEFRGVSHTASGKPDYGKTMLTYGTDKSMDYTMPAKQFDSMGNNTGNDTSVSFFINISGVPGSGVGSMPSNLGFITLRFEKI